jgi:hypothetical protein
MLVVFVTAELPAQSGPPPRVWFDRPVETPLTGVPVLHAVTADVNRDGLADLVASTFGNVLVSFGSGGGAFSAPETYAINGPGTFDVATGDFNGDARLDIVVNALGINVLLGRGDGSFAAPCVSLGGARAVVVADFDGDGLDDIAGIGRNAVSPIPETVDVYRSLGTGCFGGFHTVATLDVEPIELAAGDFNDDGRPDLAIGLPGPRQVFVQLNLGGFTFRQSDAPVIPAGPVLVATADLDRNNTIDLVTVDQFGTVSWVSGSGDGTFSSVRTFAAQQRPCHAQPCPFPVDLVVHDLDGDETVDIAAAYVDAETRLLLNHGAGVFGHAIRLRANGEQMALLAGDFDGDGLNDVAVISSVAGQSPGGSVVSTFLTETRGGGQV